MRAPLHSFVVCAYGRSPYLQECVESLVRQTKKSRILIATSTPNEMITAVAEQYNLRVIVNPRKCGIAADWNFALRQTDTRLVTIAHQDDVYEPEYTEKVLKAFRKRQDAIILFTDYRELRGSLDTASGGWKTGQSRLVKVKHLMLSPLRVRFLQKSRWVRRRILSLGNPICCPAVTYVKGRTPEPLFHGEMKSNIDWQAWEQLSRQRGAFVYIPEPLMQHRIHEESTTSALVGDHARREEDLYMYRKFWPGKIPELIWWFYGRNEKYQ